MTILKGLFRFWALYSSYFSAPAPIPYSLPEANALIYARGISKNTYQIMRNGAKQRNANIYPTWNDLLAYRKNECTPDEIKFEDMTVTASMQSVLDHQLKKTFDDPLLLERSSVLHMDTFNEPLEYIIKYGFDGYGQVSILWICLSIRFYVKLTFGVLEV